MPCSGGDANAMHESFMEIDMLALVTMCRVTICDCAHVQVFCSTIQFGDVYNLLQSKDEGER